MTVLVAGGSGYIGQATVRALNAHGHQAVALTRNARATRRIELAQAGGGGQPVPQIFPAGLQGIGPARGAAARALTAADYGPAQPAAAMLHSDYPLQALLYSVVLH
ncbi:MAG TPA: NAD-dependent epimerase/dehydratase family protein, partial [Mycobacterium sp.]|nr:NAD-dependent epimerase/dehydratase family protein [Mycobacterium sp.]